MKGYSLTISKLSLEFKSAGDCLLFYLNVYLLSKLISTQFTVTYGRRNLTFVWSQEIDQMQCCCFSVLQSTTSYVYHCMMLTFIFFHLHSYYPYWNCNSIYLYLVCMCSYFHWKLWSLFQFSALWCVALSSPT